MVDKQILMFINAMLLDKGLISPQEYERMFDKIKKNHT